MEELHLFIIWHNALNKKESILEDIDKNFEIVKKYMVQWSLDKFSENLSRFYGTNLPPNSGKEQHCGTGPFMLIIVKDKNPIYEIRTTSRGNEIVNINMFDKKNEYRQLTGGGHKIHATNNPIETDHDLTLLLHISVEDFLKQEQTAETENLDKDLFGAYGWENASQMFYALNHGTKYAVLRNYETLPEEIYVNAHNDIDLICESKENCAYVLNAKKVFEEKYRVHYVTDVGDKKAYFDLRYVGDNYYCEKLEKDILETRIYHEKGFYTIEKEFYFYTLLYHALLHKKNFASDYRNRLMNMKQELVREEAKEQELIYLLEKWLLEKQYLVKIPKDKSVLFNQENARKINKGLVDWKEENDKTGYEAIEEQLKNNIIAWYPFKEGANIWEIAEDDDKLNLTTGEQEKLDYIVIINQLEKVLSDLDKIIGKLKQDGKLLIIEDNKLALQNICQSEKNKGGYNRKEIERILEEHKLNYKKMYYVLPDYKKANVVFTDKHLPDEETIQRNLTFYKEDSIVNYSENKLYEEILEQDRNLFKVFANSFFIECSRMEFPDNEIEFVSYANIRKEKYQIKTIIKGKEVYKTFANEKAKQHIEQIKKNIDIMNQNKIHTLDYYKDDCVISRYQAEKETLEKILIHKIQNHEMESVKKIMMKFYEELKEKLIRVEKEQNVFDKYHIPYKGEEIENLTFVKYGLWDLIFQNAFYMEEEFFFYDQEWIEENMPIEYILYRAIKYSKNLLTKEKFYDMIKINEKNRKIFDELDDILQKQTRSEENWRIHSEAKEIEKRLEQVQKEKEIMQQEALKLLNEKDARIKFLEENMEATCHLLHEKEQQIIAIENSTSWKITKPLRRIKKAKKGEKNENKR